MPDRGDGVYSELNDFLLEIKCPECNAAMKQAPVWDFVLRKGWSTCGSCWQIFSLKSGAKLEGFAVRSEDLERVADDFASANASEYVWDQASLERSRTAAVDFFISVGLTAFFDGLERNYPILNDEDFKLTWKYLSQAGALAVQEIDTRLIADAFEKVEKYKPRDWNA
jgi:hypothetical protein